MLVLHIFKRTLIFTTCSYALIFIAALFVFGIAFAINFAAGSGISSLALSADRLPFYAGEGGWLHLDSPETTWDVVLRVDDEDYPLSVVDVRSAIKYVLTHPDGWADAGLKFQHVEATAQSPDILFVLLPIAIIEEACGLSSAACAQSEGYSYLRAFPLELRMHAPSPNPNVYGIEARASCYVLLNRYQPDAQFFIHDVNHEAGHCLGLNHSSDETHVMRQGDVPFPNASEIELIKKRLNKLKK